MLTIRATRLVLIISPFLFVLTNALSQNINECERAFKILGESKKLLTQTDPNLKARELLPDAGGLCGPTCIVNLVDIAAEVLGKEHLGANSLSHEEIISSIVGRAKEMFGRDARFGIFSEQLKSLLTRHLSESGISAKVSQKEIVTLADLMPSSDQHSLFIIELRSYGFKIEDRWAGRGHYLILVKYDSLGSLATFSDPNYPNRFFLPIMAKVSPVAKPWGDALELKFISDNFGYKPNWEHIITSLTRVDFGKR